MTQMIADEADATKDRRKNNAMNDEALKYLGYGSLRLKQADASSSSTKSVGFGRAKSSLYKNLAEGIEESGNVTARIASNYRVLQLLVSCIAFFFIWWCCSTIGGLCRCDSGRSHRSLASG